MTTFSRTINGISYNVVCESYSTRNSWGHTCKLYKDYNFVSSARCRYYNRTWEAYQYQSVIISSVWALIQEVTNNLKEAFKTVYGYKVLTATRKAAFEAWKAEQQEYKDVHALLESFR